MNLVLLTFGDRLENHYQAAFAVLSFLHDPSVRRVIILTDRKEFYRFFGDRIDIIEIDNQILTDWQGAYQFFWRIKIKALESVQMRYPNDHLLYIDSDTFLAGSLDRLRTELAQGRALMHKCECTLAQETSKTLRKMHRTLNGKTVAGITINGQSEMWNAGVIALPAEQAADLIRLSLQLCDAICQTDCPRYLVEQFSFSLALKQLSGLTSCERIIGHYWGNKSEWNQMIADFFTHALLHRLTLSECIARAAQSDWRRLPLTKKQRNTNQKLKALIDRLWRDKNIGYLP